MKSRSSQYLPAILAFCVLAIAAGPALLAQNITFSQNDRLIQFPAQNFVQGDINRDGRPDFLFQLAASTNIFALRSNGGSYVNSTIPTAYCPSVPLAFGDFQRNGRNDLLVSNLIGARCGGVPFSATFADYLNDGTGAFRLYQKFPVSFTDADAVVTADFNGDQKLDAVVLDGSRLELYYGNGGGGFAGPYLISNLTGTAASLTGSFFNLIAGDFDGNGCTDVAWTEYEAYGQRGFKSQLKVAYGNCRGGFSVATPYDVIGQIDNIQTADLNRDGVSDIVASLDTGGQGVINPTVQISYGRRSRTFSTKLITDSSFYGLLQVADFNGDGYPDIAYVANQPSGASIKILQGSASQSFSGISVHYLSGEANTQPLRLLSGDYNRDGKTDLAYLTGGPVAAGTPNFTLLTNTSAYPGGTCVPPVTPGIHVCSPGATSGTTVKVLAAGANPNPTVYMELRVDGVRQLGYGSTSELRGTITVPAGTHRFDYYSADAAGIRNSLSTTVTIR